MLFSRHITIPANTSQANSINTKVKVSVGYITKIWVTFPAGCIGLAKLRIYNEGHPFLPDEQNEYISGDNYTFDYPVMFPIKEEPMTLTIQTWNEDTAYQHIVQVQMLVLPGKIALPLEGLGNLVMGLISLFKRKV